MMRIFWVFFCITKPLGEWDQITILPIWTLTLNTSQCNALKKSDWKHFCARGRRDENFPAWICTFKMMGVFLMLKTRITLNSSSILYMWSILVDQLRKYHSCFIKHWALHVPSLPRQDYRGFNTCAQCFLKFKYYFSNWCFSISIIHICKTLHTISLMKLDTCIPVLLRCVAR